MIFRFAHVCNGWLCLLDMGDSQARQQKTVLGAERGSLFPTLTLPTFIPPYSGIGASGLSGLAIRVQLSTLMNTSLPSMVFSLMHMCGWGGFLKVRDARLLRWGKLFGIPSIVRSCCWAELPGGGGGGPVPVRLPGPFG